MDHHAYGSGQDLFTKHADTWNGTSGTQVAPNQRAK